MPEAPNDDAAFIRSLLEVHRSRQTGLLEVRADGLCTLVYVQKGTPVFAEQGALGETFGRLLVQKGLLSEEQHAAVIDRMTETVFSSEQLKFGEVAVALGYLGLAEVNDALAEQVRKKVLHCMQWSAPLCEFEAAADALQGMARYPCPVEPLLMQGLREFFDEERLRPLWEASAPRFAALAETPETIAPRFKLDSDERALLDHIDGSRKVSQLVAPEQPHAASAARVVSALLLTGALVVYDSSQQAEQQAHAARSLVRVPGGRPVAFGQPTQAASTPSVSGTIERGAAVPSAPAAAAPKADAEKPTAGSPQAASAPVPRSAPRRITSSMLPPAVKRWRLRAEQMFQSGRAHLREGHWAAALVDFDKAAELHPEAIEYRLHAAWAEFRTLDDPERMEELKKQLAKLALRAVRQDRDMAFPHYVHGQLFLMAGDEEAAYRSFRFALKLDPGDKDAERHYRVLERRLRGDKGH